MADVHRIMLGGREIAAAKQPTPTYNSFHEYVRRCALYTSKDVQWPCLACDAKGWVYDPNDPPCPVEGNKMRDRIDCPWCKGTGEGKKTDLQEAYKQQRLRHLKRLQKYKRMVELATSAVNKLTPEELHALHAMLDGKDGVGEELPATAEVKCLRR